jgi:hypothetical protein
MIQEILSGRPPTTTHLIGSLNRAATFLESYLKRFEPSQQQVRISLIYFYPLPSHSLCVLFVEVLLK